MRKIQLFLTCLVLILATCTLSIFAQNSLNSPIIPNFWDGNIRLTKPLDLKIKRLRFLTTTDFPPFNFIDRDKRLGGFHIDLAREVCRELKILRLCQVQALPWGELSDAVANKEGEAIIAGLAYTSKTKENFDFSSPYLHIPARFVALRTSGLKAPMIKSLFKKNTGIIKGSDHARYFKSVFTGRNYTEFTTATEARKALVAGEIATLFSDAVSLSFWIQSRDAAQCCVFVGGPYLATQYFGNGMRIAIGKGNPKLVDAINFALRRINDSGKFRELYLRYFPVGLY